MIKYLHIRNFKLDETGYETRVNNLGGATVAYTIVNDNQIKYQVAYCSDSENYSKSFGRDLAKNRLDTVPKILDLPVKSLCNLYDFFALII